MSESSVALEIEHTPDSPVLRVRGARSRGFSASDGFGYNAGSITRRALTDWFPSLGGPNTDTLLDLPTTRARSRDLARNAPLATGALNTIVTTTVGTGLEPQAKIDRKVLGLTQEQAAEWQSRAETLYWAHFGAEACDIEGRENMAGLQELVLRSALESGDAFVIRRFRERPGDVLGLKLQVLEADRVSNPANALNTDRLIGGVEVDGDGMAIAYHVLNRHPGEFFTPGVFAWERIPAFAARTGERQVRHIMRPTRPGQRRGMPLLAPVIETLKQISRLSEAELAAAVVNAFFTVFIKTADGENGMAPIDATDTTTASGRSVSSSEYKMGPAAMLDLAAGEDVVFADPKRPNPALEAFFEMMLREVGVAIELPFEFLVKHFTSSYSASRAALLEAWRAVVTRRGWLVRQFCQPSYEWGISEAVTRGYLNAPGFFESPLLRRAWLGTVWIGSVMGQLNPLDEVNASEKAIQIGISSIAKEAVKNNGGDSEQIHEERVREHSARVAGGLEPPVLVPAGASAPATSTADQRDSADQAERQNAGGKR
ncbi:MAG TPA: phage portal protein [Gemmatimonadaceae bacterium]|nr:phage portal protein [Gemmatimonadaceae bacterium]